jgi:hyperosmotically inducible protein
MAKRGVFVGESRAKLLRAFRLTKSATTSSNSNWAEPRRRLQKMKGFLFLTLVSAVSIMPVVAARNAVVQTPGTTLEREVRHELVMLPYYSVFDNLAYEVNGGTVILTGKVTKPVLKDDAERAVKHIEGVERVENRIEVLPLSPFDDRIRVAAFRSIYGTPALNRYAHQAIPPIHIIVENGKITLEGVVANDMDSNWAYTKARQVHGAFSVTNHLRVEVTQSQKTN